MRWSPRGAHLLVQIRLAVLEGSLQNVFRRWYPRLQMPVGREVHDLYGLRIKRIVYTLWENCLFDPQSVLPERARPA